MEITSDKFSIFFPGDPNNLRFLFSVSGELQCATAMCYRVWPLQWDRKVVLLMGNELQFVAVYCSVLQCGAVCCSVLWLRWDREDVLCMGNELQSVAVCCRVLQSVAECCSVLQCARFLERVHIYGFCLLKKTHIMIDVFHRFSVTHVCIRNPMKLDKYVSKITYHKRPVP